MSEWYSVHPSYCEWYVLQAAPVTIILMLKTGKAEMNNNGHVKEMHPDIPTAHTGYVAIHNKDPEDEQREAEGQNPQTEVQYRFLP